MCNGDCKCFFDLPFYKNNSCAQCSHTFNLQGIGCGRRCYGNSKASVVSTVCECLAKISGARTYHSVSTTGLFQIGQHDFCSAPLETPYRIQCLDLQYDSTSQSTAEMRATILRRVPENTADFGNGFLYSIDAESCHEDMLSHGKCHHKCCDWHSVYGFSYSTVSVRAEKIQVARWPVRVIEPMACSA